MGAKSKFDRVAGLFGTATAMFAAMAGAQPALAQEEGANALPELVITAERRDQNLQDVSLAATVLSADLIEDYGVDNVSELQQVAPSVAINTYNRSTFINIRGVGIAQSAPTSNPGVAYYLDGVYIPHEQFIGQSFFDVNGIEVLRGPQGTLTGQNSTGGAIYVRSPNPELGEWSGSLDQTLGDYNWRRTVGTVNVPLGNFAALRLAGVRDVRDSFSTNIGPAAAEPGNVNLNAWRASLLIDPEGPLQILARYHEFDNDTFHNAIKRRNDVVSLDPFVIQEDAESLFQQEGYIASVEARYDLTESVQLRWLTSYLNAFTFDISDGDRTATAPPRPPAGNVGRVSRALTDYNTVVHEFNVLSQGDQRIDWVVGAFYLEEEIPLRLDRDNNNTVFFVAPTSDIRTNAMNTSQSVFGQAGFELNEQWELIVGARYSEDEQVYVRTVGPPPVLGTSSISTDAITGRVALNYTPHEDMLIYGSIARGYKAGGVNLNLLDGFYQPETNTVAELGVKTTTMDGRLRVNANVFVSEYEDIQLASLAGAPPLPVTQNAAGGRSWGFELESFARFGNFNVNFGVAYLVAEFDGNSILQDAILNANVLVPDGNPLPFSPEWTASGGIAYDFVFGDGRVLTPRLQFSHIGEQLATPFRHVATVVPERTIWDAKLIFEPSDDWRLEAFASNVFDEVYIASQVQNSSSADGGIIYGAPRQIGVRISANF